MSLRFIHVVACIRNSFIFVADWYSIKWIYCIYPVFCQQTFVWFPIFRLLWIKRAVNGLKQIFLWTEVIFEWIRVESMVIAWCAFHITRNTVFWSGCTILCSSCNADFNYSTSSPKFSVCRLLDLSHFSGYEEVSYCDLISISLMTDDVEYLFICLLVFIYFLLQSVFSSILCILNWAASYFIIEGTLWILDINPLWDIYIMNTFFYTIAIPFHFLSLL